MTPLGRLTLLLLVSPGSLVKPSGQPSAVKLAPRVRGNRPFSRQRSTQPGDRGLSYGYDWTQTNNDNQITVPWTVTSSLTVENFLKLKHAMDTLERDVGCVKFPFISQADLPLTSWANGIVFVYQDELVDVGCYSIVGQYYGFSDGSIFSSIVDTGAPPDWQMVALADNCDGLSESTIHHEVMHALGFPHEHSRPDRDLFLDLNWRVITYEEQLAKVDMKYWSEDPFQFDMSSVMLYCSMCASDNYDVPAMTLKDGTVFETPLRTSTIDILEIQ